MATHELGHVLGLPHNEDPVSVMNPRELHRKGVITDNDIWYLKRLYRKRNLLVKQQRFRRTTTDRAEAASSNCRPPDDGPANSNRSAEPVLYSSRRHRNYPRGIRSLQSDISWYEKRAVVQNEWMWRVSRDGNILQQPEKTSLILSQVNSSIDAAVNIHEDLWLFSGTRATLSLYGHYRSRCLCLHRWRQFPPVETRATLVD